MIGAVGYRFVHGGTELSRTARIDDAALAALHCIVPLAPIHNPNSPAGRPNRLQRPTKEFVGSMRGE